MHVVLGLVVYGHEKAHEPGEGAWALGREGVENSTQAENGSGLGVREPHDQDQLL